ncbi:hypothetical protein FACS189429_5550 [Bacteroidia bacterium]|nr:hypothetical protein FACS189429_5550 [Bacteroidia bacterium]
MKNFKLKTVAFLVVVNILNVNSQQINTQYFLENSPLRHYWNPAFQPMSDTYISLPLVGYLQAGLTNNSLSVSNIFFNKNGKTVTFLHPEYGSVGDFYNSLSGTTGIFPDLRLNLLGFGFRSGENAYINFTASLRVDGGVGVPKDMFNLLLNGTPNINGDNLFNLKNLGFNATAFMEIAGGYSTALSDQLTVGAKLKLLLGTANIRTNNKKLELNASMEDWLLSGEGTVNIASPYEVQTGTTLNDLKLTPPDNILSFFSPAGIGGGIDLGIAYKPIEQLTISAAVNDLGLIFWKNKNTASIKYTVNYKFEGMGNLRKEDLTLNQVFDSIGNAFKDATTTNATANGYMSSISPKLNVGAEYGFLDNKLSAGILSRTMLNGGKFYEELTVSANARPVRWFNTSISYSIFNGKFSSIGLGIGLRTGPLHWLISTDYLAFEYAKYDIIPVPYKTKAMNIGIGLNIVIGNAGDKDKDGVSDNKDLCPETPFGVIVDENGCPVDSDHDGVPDYMDKCADTPQEAVATIDENGCPKDTDGDGIPDYLDKCPETPAAAIGMTDENGCPLDSDGDGTPDYLDKCPDTPREAMGTTDENGCPKDTDGDGVLDYLDKCPDTPAGATVDANGCSKDTDGDGVPDYLDKCPNTPKAAYGQVDENGCPKDTDGDGIADYLDKCPKVAGTNANSGCPEVKKEVTQLFQKALRGIQFDTNKATIKKVSFPILNDIVKVMVENPTYKLTVKGHTDSDGNDEHNLQLSKDRAAAVAKYLTDNGIDTNRIVAEGYGETQPVADNKTSKGKALNRRVEFVVEFEEKTFE